MAIRIEFDESLLPTGKRSPIAVSMSAFFGTALQQAQDAANGLGDLGIEVVVRTEKGDVFVKPFTKLGGTTKTDSAAYHRELGRYEREYESRSPIASDTADTKWTDLAHKTTQPPREIG